VNEKLIEGLINSISEVMKDMESREVDQYWFGQLTASLDIHNIDVYELMYNKKLKYFKDEDIYKNENYFGI
jgi:hypothetical protein